MTAASEQNPAPDSKHIAVPTDGTDEVENGHVAPAVYDTAAAPSETVSVAEGAELADEHVPAVESRRDVLHYDPSGETAPQQDTRDDVPEQILFQWQFCLHSKGGACTRCEAACPQAAISYEADGRVSIDDAACSRCGICYGICDAFTSNKVNIIGLRAQIARMTAVDKVLYLTCRENIFSDMQPAENVLVLPCLAAASPELITSILLDVVRVVIAADLDYCEDCPIAPDCGEMLYTYAFQTAEQWSGMALEFVDNVPEQTHLMDRVNRDNRRDALSGLMSAVGDIASGHYRSARNSALEDYDRASAKLHAVMAELTASTFPAFNRPGKTKTWFPRRELIVEAALAEPDRAAQIGLMTSTTDSNRCTCALDCVDACISGARGIDDEGRLTFDDRYCIGCGICVDACAQGACAVRQITADELQGPQTVESRARQVDTSASESTQSTVSQTAALDADSLFGTPDSQAD